MAFLPAQSGIQASLNDKFLHTCAFFVFAFLGHIAYPSTRYIMMFAGLAVFGIGIEVVQAYLPYRSFEIKDWLADMSGCLIYYLVFSSFLRDKCLRYKCAPD